MSRVTAYYHDEGLELRGEQTPEEWIVVDRPVAVEE